MIIELVAVAVSFLNGFGLIGTVGMRVLFYGARRRSQTHGPAEGSHLFLFFKKADDRIFCFLIKLGRIRALPIEHVACKFNHRALHPETNPEKRDLASTREFDRFQFSFDAPHAEPARDKNTVDFFEIIEGIFFEQLFGIDAFDLHGNLVGQSSVNQGFVDGFVGVLKVNVFADDRDFNAAFRMPGLFDHVIFPSVQAA